MPDRQTGWRLSKKLTARDNSSWVMAFCCFPHRNLHIRPGIGRSFALDFEVDCLFVKRADALRDLVSTRSVIKIEEAWRSSITGQLGHQDNGILLGFNFAWMILPLSS